MLTAHGSDDPRSAANARAVAGRLARVRPDLDVRVAFCERNSPSLPDVLASATGTTVVTPLLLAAGYHARIDVPAVIAGSGVGVRQADVLGEDDQLLAVLRERLVRLGVSRFDSTLGVLVVAVGSSNTAANAATGRVAGKLAAGTRWAGATTAFATGAGASLPEAADQLRRRGARRLVIAPWFLAPGRLTDRVLAYAHGAGIPMAEPLGAHPLVAATVLDRFEDALTASGLAA